MQQRRVRMITVLLSAAGLVAPAEARDAIVVHAPGDPAPETASANRADAAAVARQEAERRPDRKPPRDQPRRGPRHTIEQATSDRGQLHTIGFSALAFLTGNFNACTFLPPGKVSDYFGFQYMRDNDAAEMGHNTAFLRRIASNVLHVLDDEQRGALIALAEEQRADIRSVAEQRLPLIEAFCRLRDADLPEGCTELDRDAVVKRSAEIYELDGRLAHRRATVLGRIASSLTDEQRSALARLSFGDSRTWPERAEPIDKRTMPHDAHVAVMTYASELFSWYAGSVEADTYFCPERHGTYFGSFYMKDAPAMGKSDYSISTELTGDSGAAFLAALTPEQRSRIEALVEIQRASLAEIVSVRRAISVELRKTLRGEPADRDRVAALARRYGELDGEISYWYATRFADVSRTLTAEQKAALTKLRGLETYPARRPYLYSKPVDLPAIADTDVLFK